MVSVPCRPLAEAPVDPSAGASSESGLTGGSSSAGRRTSTDYVYVMQFQGDKIVHMTKIWHAGLAMKELGWVAEATA